MVLGSVGAIAAGSPILAGIILTSDNVANGTIWVITLLVGISSIGAGVGKLYSRWKAQIASSIKRDELLADLCRRVQRIEERQIAILERLDSSY